MVPDPFSLPCPTRLDRLGTVRDSLPLPPCDRLAGWLYGVSLLALVAGLFVVPVVLTVGFGVPPVRAARGTLVAVVAGYALWLVPLLGDAPE